MHRPPSVRALAALEAGRCPARYIAPVQTQPIEVPLADLASPSSYPSDWLLAGPTQYDDRWRRVVVDQVMAGWHSAYLVGLALVCAGLAVRRARGRLLAAAGLFVALVSVAAQVAVAP